MSKTASGCDITLTVDYIYNDSELTLTNFQYSVYNAAGTLLTGPTTDPDFDADNTSSTITIDGTHNTITTKKDIRHVVCSLVTVAGTYRKDVFYEVEGNVLLLTPLEDSFVTYPESVLIRSRISEPLTYYDALTDELKAVVLANAYDRINNLSFSYDAIQASTPSPLTYDAQTLSDLSTGAFNALNARFLEAVKKAQIVEANSLVEYSPVSEKIRAGIISETIGESSMFFSQKNLDRGSDNKLGISDEAYAYLGKWLFKGTSNSQIWKVRRA